MRRKVRGRGSAIVASGTQVPDGGASDPGSGHISRRQFIGYSAAAGGLMLTGVGCAPPGSGGGGGASFTGRLRRASDQLDLNFEFFNLHLVTGGGAARLEKLNGGANAYMTVTFGPQALADRAFFKSSGQLPTSGELDPPEPAETQESPTVPPVEAALSGSSRLAFEIPDAVLPLEYTAANLLAWVQFVPRVVPHADDHSHTLPDVGIIGPGGAAFLNHPPVRAPEADETGIELPWRLVLSPHSNSAWAHHTSPVVHDGRTELWHTRLAVRATDGNNAPVVDEDDAENRTVRAVWARDPGFALQVTNPTTPTTLSNDEPFRMSLNARDRLDLVRMTSDWSLDHREQENFELNPVKVNNLMLTGLGGWLDSSYENDLLFKDADPGPNGQKYYNSSLLQWRHIAAGGRDSYARIVRKGWLCACGFKAALFKITEREFELVGTGGGYEKGAYLRQRMFIVCTHPIRNFVADPDMQHAGRRMPFRKLICLTKVSPDLDAPKAYDPFYSENQVFVPEVGGAPFRFKVRGIDWAGNEHDFEVPMVFIDDTLAYDASDLAPILAKYNNTSSGFGVGVADQVDLQGAKVALAAPKVAGDTEFGVSSLALGAEPPVSGYDPGDMARAGKPGFYPALYDATVMLSEVGNAAGNAVPPSVLSYYGPYVDHGFGDGADPNNSGAPNRGDVFLGPPPGSATPAKLGVATKNSGGIGAPALSVQGLSRAIGPTGDPDDTADAKFTPTKYLDDGVTLLGGVLLVEVLEAVSDFFTDGGTDKALTMTSTRDADRVITDIDWHPELKAGPADLNLIAPDGLGNATVDIHTKVVTDLANPDESSVDVKGHMADFVVLLFGGNEDGSANETSTFIRLPVKTLDFTAGTLSKEELHTQLGDISFHSVLKFVEKLAEVMSFGDSGGLKIDVTGNGIEIELNIALPDITLGVMSLTNMAIFLGVKIPFDGSPVELYFSFCSRENPFTLTVWIFGGGGFVGLAVSVRGLELLEFSFEFGGGYALSIAVASGKVEVKAGIYFKVETKEKTGVEFQECVLEAYIRLAGSCEILGLISVSVEFYLCLTYTDPPGNLVGTATVTVTIDLTIWSGSVSATVQKELASGEGGGGTEFMSQPGMSGARSARTGRAAASSPTDPPELEGPKITFEDLLTQGDWAQYAKAYAPAGM